MEDRGSGVSSDQHWLVRFHANHHGLSHAHGEGCLRTLVDLAVTTAYKTRCVPPFWGRSPELA